MTELAGLTPDTATEGRWVLDPAGSRADFYVKHFWGAITVHGWFERLSGAGTVGPDGTVTGTLRIEAASLDTRNKARDKHLRSADFFDVEHHPSVTVTVSAATAAGPGALACTGTVEAAGHVEPLEFTARVEPGDGAVTLRAEITIDRTLFGMTWSPLRIASSLARATVVARFTRNTERRSS